MHTSVGIAIVVVSFLQCAHSLSLLPKQAKQTNNECKNGSSLDRRSVLIAATTTAATIVATPSTASAEITSDSQWPLWPALPVAPYSRRKTIRKEIVSGQVWTFDQLIGIYYVHVPIRMTVVTMSDGLLVYAPVAPTKECLSLLDDIIAQHGPIKYIILPSVAVEHKVNAGPFARQFPSADFYIADRQYSFPVTLPNEFLGLPKWAKPLPENDPGESPLFGDNIHYELLTVKPGPGSMYQDVALLHKPSKTLLVCDAIFAATADPPAILVEEPEYTRALLFHARDSKDESVEDTLENRRKGWRRIVLLFNFFFPGSATADLGPGPILEALKTPGYKTGWGGWMPVVWNAATEELDFDTYSSNGKPLIYTIVQIILSRAPDKVEAWLKKVTAWQFERVIPAHLDAPLNIGPAEFREAFSFLDGDVNRVRFCDEDVAFLRQAQEGFLSFSIYQSRLGPLIGRNGPCGL